MSIFKTIRQEKNLSQNEIAGSCGMSRYNWYCIESGRRLPHRAQIEKLGKALPCEEDCLTTRQIRFWSRPPVYHIESVNPEAWCRAQKHWAYRIESFGLSPAVLEWMENVFPCDSSIEAFGWAQVATLEGQRQVSSPHELGFDRHPIVLKCGAALGIRRLAGLQGRHGRLYFAVWPQVSLRTPSSTFRVDGLVLLRWGRRSMWAILEFDGHGHEPERDEFRREKLGLAEIRLSGHDVRSLRVAELFVRQATSKMTLGDLSPED